MGKFWITNSCFTYGIVMILFCVLKGVCGQVLTLTSVTQTDPCLTDGNGRVIVEGTADFTGVNPATWNSQVHLFDQTRAICTVVVDASDCSYTSISGCYCQEVNDDVYNVVMNLTANDNYDGQNITLKVIDTISFELTSSNIMKYPQLNVEAVLTLDPPLSGNTIPEGTQSFTVSVTGLKEPFYLKYKNTTGNYQMEQNIYSTVVYISDTLEEVCFGYEEDSTNCQRNYTICGNRTVNQTTTGPTSLPPTTFTTDVTIASTNVTAFSEGPTTNSPTGSTTTVVDDEDSGGGIEDWHIIVIICGILLLIVIVVTTAHFKVTVSREETKDMPPKSTVKSLFEALKCSDKTPCKLATNPEQKNPRDIEHSELISSLNPTLDGNSGHVCVTVILKKRITTKAIVGVHILKIAKSTGDNATSGGGDPLPSIGTKIPPSENGFNSVQSSEINEETTKVKKMKRRERAKEGDASLSQDSVDGKDVTQLKTSPRHQYPPKIHSEISNDMQSPRKLPPLRNAPTSNLNV